MRKNLGIWKTWQPMDGGGLHGVQLCILQRAMKMLTPQGRVVYSKCSLNPVENEANIALPPRRRVPALHRHPGLTAWRPTDKSLCTTYNPYDTFMKTCTGGDMVKAKMSRGHWPPEDVEKLEMDTGGFFVAVLERKKTEEEAVEAVEAVEALSRADTRCTQELKREADDSAEIPEPKKPRLDADGVAPKVEDIAAKVEDVAAKAEEAPEAPAPPLPSPLCMVAEAIANSTWILPIAHPHPRRPPQETPSLERSLERGCVQIVLAEAEAEVAYVIFFCFLPVGLHRTFLGGKFATLQAWREGYYFLFWDKDLRYLALVYGFLCSH
ncbi:hypothetical protein K438DRAFT_1785033 [Mycena galopus ATCC 62051]|nr:hypothetical protein K438DRAFT_1785033 [Mycena galopus ATCC 62051]